jgi:hypothetical protein
MAAFRKHIGFRCGLHAHFDSASQFRRLAVEGDLGEPALFETPGSSPGSFLNQSGHDIPAGQPYGSRHDGVKRQTEAQVKAKLVQVMKAPCKMFADKFMGTGRESVRKLLIIFQGLEGTSSDYRVFQSGSLYEQCWSIFTENHCGAKPLAFLWEQLALWRDTNKKPVSYPAPTTWLGWITEQYQQPDQVDEYHTQIIQIILLAPYPDPKRCTAPVCSGAGCHNANHHAISTQMWYYDQAQQGRIQAMSAFKTS